MPTVYDYSTPVTRRKDSGSSVYTTESARIDATRLITLHSLSDDGAGAFVGGLGTVDYVGKIASLKVVSFDRLTTSYKSDYENASEFTATTSGAGSSSGSTSQEGGEYGTTSVGEQVLAGSSVVASYKVGSPTPTARSTAYAPPEVVIDLCRYTTDRIVPNSVRFVWMGETYEDQDGVIYRRTGSGNGVASGSIDYMAGIAKMTDYVVSGSPTAFTLQSLWTSKEAWRTASVFFMTSTSPIVPGQITITLLDVAGNAINVSCDLNGNLSGPHAVGKINFQSGLGELQFGDFVTDSTLTAADKAEWWYDPVDVGAVEAGKIWRPWPVDPASLRINTTSSFYLPVDPEIAGLDPVRLPQDGRVPKHRKGRVIIIGHNATLEPATYAATDVIDLGRERVTHVWLFDANGALIDTGFEATEADLNAGQVRVIDVTGWAQPVTVEHRIQEMRQTMDLQIDGTMQLNFGLSYNFPAGSVVSSALLWGNTFARFVGVWDQQSWNGITWADSTQGNEAPATYNIAANPIIVANAGALSERYAWRYKDTENFDFIGEFSGFMGTGSKNVDHTPGNPFDPATRLLELKAAGWGGGWAAGNVLFGKMVAAMQSFALIRTVQPSVAPGTDYSFDLLTGGDVDRPPSAP
ncbi:hypothetical protein [Hydrogenophaga sp.]|uniref:hypothetical protein n=1 Tax=Hydrogenophaga sp. TaxID=1904254 RepID=UPI002736EAE2|nr:hypothetical protein [Hydrogenophaga sp.]MDP3887012.1 hypothetical protein [Hydrogenophaga sp.]